VKSKPKKVSCSLDDSPVSLYFWFSFNDYSDEFGFEIFKHERDWL